MNCNDVQNFRRCTVSGELDAERAAALAAHLPGLPRIAPVTSTWMTRLSKAVLAEPVDTRCADLAIRRGLTAKRALRRMSIAAGSRRCWWLAFLV